MKKFAITLCILGGLSIAPGAFAAIQSEDISTVPHLKSEGYSTGMTHITDTVKYHHSNGTAEPYYNQDPLAGATDEKGKWYTVVKRWLDPAQDDGMFGNHDITFTNDWFEMDSPFQYQKENKETYVKPEKNTDVYYQDDAPMDEIESL